MLVSNPPDSLSTYSTRFLAQIGAFVLGLYVEGGVSKGLIWGASLHPPGLDFHSVALLICFPVMVSIRVATAEEHCHYSNTLHMGFAD